ncbi:nucleolin-like [Solanum pennellii]|uniref:Nucleolin-like n=1 Tax=Solanum pennellii TaxID=28526 RepID=A0ABM1V1U5_SOLPN|nr:nucleolin-like [Solanum pennellii]
MPQNKRKRIGTSSPNPTAGENAKSYTSAKKRGIIALITSKSSNNLLVEEKSDENSGKQSSGEEKGDESENNVSSTNSRKKESDDESDEDKSSEEEKSDESESESGGNKLSREERSNENDEDKSSGEEKGDESESEQLVEKEEEDIESSPDHVKIISNGTYKFKTHLNVSGSYDSRINVRVDFGVQFVEFRKILIAQNIENDFKKSCFGHFLKLDNDVAVQLPMKLEHGLNLRRIFSEKKKEVRIDYYGLPICFGINDFAIIT